MRRKGLILRKTTWLSIVLVHCAITVSAWAETADQQGARFDKKLTKTLERVNCQSSAIKCSDIKLSMPTLDENPMLDVLERAYWSRRYLNEGKPHRAYLALLQIPKSWWRSESLRKLERRVLKQLGLLGPTSGLHLFDGPILRHLDSWVASLINQMHASQSWQIISSAWRHRHQSVEEVIRVVRADIKVRGMEQSVRNALTNRDPKLALERLDSMSKAGDLPCWWWYLKTKSLRNLRQWSEAQSQLEKSVESCRSHEPSHPWLLLLGTRIHAVRGARPAAFRLANQLKEQYPHHRLHDDAIYRLIRLHLDGDDGLEDALALANLNVKNRTVGDRNDDATFQVSLALINAERWSDAEALLEQACASPHWRESDGEEGRCQYWLTRVQEKNGQPRQSAYRELYHRYPFSWYGLLAAQRAQIDIVKIGAERRLRNQTFNTQLEEFLAELNRVTATGQSAEAHLFLKQSKAFITDLIEKPLRNIECNKLRADLCLRLAESLQPVATREPPTRQNSVQMERYFPKAYGRHVRRQSERQSVPSNLIWAIMREESRFERRAVSFVGAKGLMQLMPATAKDMAKAEGIRRPQVFHALTNIRLGTRYLQFVQRYVKRSWVVIPPGYNAGQGALKRWINRDPDQEFDLFVENLPYDEARSYTKRVNRSFAVYRLLSGASPYPMIGKLGELTSPH